MMDSQELERQRFEQAGQGQVFDFWDELEPAQREALCRDTGEIDLDEVDELVRTLVKGSEGEAVSFDGLEPAPYIAHPARGGDKSLWAAAYRKGEEALRAGKVATFTVAGGQGTRLGYDGPKGTFPVTPVSGKCLFAVFAEKILAAGNRYGVKIPWFIMTSTLNHEATCQAFAEAGYFGLDPEQVVFFSQGRMPAVDFDGKILMESKSSVSMTPDGHGGSLRALVRSGSIARMKQEGIEMFTCFQVDNPLVQVIDPAFIGFHLSSQAEQSCRMIPKAYAGEKVGHFCARDGRPLVVEYSDLPTSMQEERDASGQLRFLAGSIAVYVFDVGFVERIAGGASGIRMPFHRAVKKIKTIDSEGNPLTPAEPNGVKFELFIFDALPFARNVVIVEALREDEFSPVKNATGIDSAVSCREDQLRQWTRWLRAAGVEVETDDSGLPAFSFEVSPLFADSEAAFVDHWNRLEAKPALKEGLVLA